MIKRKIAMGKRTSLCCNVIFWRTKAGVEVDFIVYGHNAFHAIEVKNADKVTRHDAAGLEAFHTDYPEATCTLLYRGTDKLKITEHCTALPIEQFLREIIYLSIT